MIQPVWLQKILTLTDTHTDGKSADELAMLLYETNEVLPYVVSQGGGFADWPLARAALANAAKSVTRVSILRGQDPQPNWRTASQRGDLIVKMQSLIVSRDVGWRPNWQEPGPPVDDVLLAINDVKRGNPAGASPSSFISTPGNADEEPHSLHSAPTEISPSSDRAAEIFRIMKTRPRWWRLLPLARRRSLLLKLVEAKGLFNGDAYLERYPDVLAAGTHPLHHYLRFGHSEGRQI